MNVLQKCQIGHQAYAVAEIGRLNGDLIRQIWVAKREAWTHKYQGRVGGDGCGHGADLSHLVLIEGHSTVVAGCCIIHAKTGDDLPVSDNSRLPIHGPAVEITRFFTTPSPGTPTTEAEQQLKLFIYGIVIYLLRAGYKRAYATIRCSFLEKLDAIGVPIVPIGLESENGRMRFVPAMMFEADELPEMLVTGPQLQRLAA